MYFRFEKVNAIAVIYFDTINESINTIKLQAAKELLEIVQSILQDKAIKAAIILSGKQDSFVVGADIQEIKALKNEAEAFAFSQHAQELFQCIANSPKPFIAAIHGTCFGGGLELALACHYRLVSDHASTQLAFPEVNLGLLPAAGGTQRLPRLVSLKDALDLLLTGKRIGAHQAKRIGLVDEVTVSFGLKETALQVAVHLLDKRVLIKKPTKRLQDRFIFRLITLYFARKSLFQKQRGLYKAPEGIIETIKIGIMQGMEKGLTAESTTFASLSQSSQSANLIRLFFLQTKHRKNPFIAPLNISKHIGVVGAGLMGSGIGLVSLKKDFLLHLVDINHHALSRAEKYLWKELGNDIERHSLTHFERNRLLSNLSTSSHYNALSKCDIVIEAVHEDILLKHQIISLIEKNTAPDCIIASNTSAIPIAQIASKSSRPDKIIGMHYFSPVPKMPLLEIIKGPQTSQETLTKACQVGLEQNKTMIIVNDGPGFYTTRILSPIFDEANFLMLEGFSLHQIDSAFTDLGFPLGPIALMDELGLDVALNVAQSLHAAFGNRVASSDWEVMQKFIDAQIKGKKSGQGLYNPSNKRFMNPKAALILRRHKTTQNNRSMSTKDIQRRLFLRMLNEAVYCLQEGILLCAEDGDVGAVYGLAFPAFMGGPFSCIDAQGAKSILAELETHYALYGERFKPSELLKKHAAQELLFCGASS